MAKNRYINTHFWQDPYVVDLDPSEKLLFLYFLTNPNTTVLGVYEIGYRQIAFDTGIDMEMVKKLIGRLQDNGKIFYELGWVVIKNFLRHQSLNPKMIKGAELNFNALPVWLKARILDVSDSLYIDFDSLLIDYGYSMQIALPTSRDGKPIHSLSPNTNLNTNLNINFNLNHNSAGVSAGRRGRAANGNAPTARKNSDQQTLGELF